MKNYLAEESMNEEIIREAEVNVTKRKQASLKNTVK